ncbi:putative signal transducing protein [Pedobacter aquatilis]|uniref:putative signal transducing protein n=1 Tax=Pedobacter aquatilis TaxID=351343 RepID=UPI00292CD0B2|nr:DUF2007 domain-containing protein [Pedobacter aquatilis]
MNDKTIVYATYYNPLEANIIKGRLEDSGFSCFLADENISTLNPLYNQAVGGIKLIVFERDVEAIKDLLAQDLSLDSAENFAAYTPEETIGVHCEKCNSINVGYGLATQPKRRSWLKIVSFLLFYLPVIANKCYHCYDCGYEFE